MYDSNVQKGTQLEEAHNTHTDTVKVPMYVENALAKVKISV
jgi:hypothetical protein